MIQGFFILDMVRLNNKFLTNDIKWKTKTFFNKMLLTIELSACPNCLIWRLCHSPIITIGCKRVWTRTGGALQYTQTPALDCLAKPSITENLLVEVICFLVQISDHISEECGSHYFLLQCDQNSIEMVSLGALTLADKLYDATQSQGL